MGEAITEIVSREMTFWNMVGHSGYLLLFISFSVSRLSVLRILTISANCFVFAHFFWGYQDGSFQWTHVKWVPVMWAVIYNIVNVLKLIQESKKSEQ